MTFPAAEVAIASGSKTLPTWAPKTFSKNRAAINSPEFLISSIGTTKKYAMLTRRYRIQEVIRAVVAADLRVLTGFLTSLRTLLTLLSPA